MEMLAKSSISTSLVVSYDSLNRLMMSGMRAKEKILYIHTYVWCMHVLSKWPR